jgi:MFS family permease
LSAEQTIAGSNTPCIEMITAADTGGQDLQPLTAQALVIAQPNVIPATADSQVQAGGVSGIFAFPDIAENAGWTSEERGEPCREHLLGMGPRAGQAPRQLALALHPWLQVEPPAGGQIAMEEHGKRIQQPRRGGPRHRSPERQAGTHIAYPGGGGCQPQPLRSERRTAVDGAAFDSGQAALNLIAVGYSLGLAASVLYLGALGDRYGRKLMLIMGVGLSIPICLLAAYSPTDWMLFIARLLGGIAAGMAYPTTLALITALWAPGPGRTRSIALWSATGGAIASLGPVVSGFLLKYFWWGSVFLITLPLAVVALVMARRYVPAHVQEATDPVDNLGGILSVLLVGALILAINFAPVPNKGALVAGLAMVALAAGAAFFIREHLAKNPLYDLHIAARRTFWVAGCAGIIVFGSLMAAMFVGQQFLQNVLGYSTFQAGLSILPAAAFMVVVAPRSAKLVEARGARFTLLTGYVFCLLGFLTMLLLWREGSAYWQVGLGYAFMGIGVGFAGTPASHSLTGSVPVQRAGMASGTADLQRDLGGAIMQSIFGALLAASFASAMAGAIGTSPEASQVTSSVQSQLTKSFASAETTAEHYPQYASQITAAAKQSFLDGDQWAYTAGIVAVLLGGVLVFCCFPKKDDEVRLLAQYHAEDTSPPAGAAAQSPTTGSG